jgi:hypothetical protein
MAVLLMVHRLDSQDPQDQCDNIELLLSLVHAIPEGSPPKLHLFDVAVRLAPIQSTASGVSRCDLGLQPSKDLLTLFNELRVTIAPSDPNATRSYLNEPHGIHIDVLTLPDLDEALANHHSAPFLILPKRH